MHFTAPAIDEPSDITVIAFDRQYQLHKSVLSKYSVYFSVLFQSQLFLANASSVQLGSCNDGLPFGCESWDCMLFAIFKEFHHIPTGLRRRHWRAKRGSAWLSANRSTCADRFGWVVLAEQGYHWRCRSRLIDSDRTKILRHRYSATEEENSEFPNENNMRNGGGYWGIRFAELPEQYQANHVLGIRDQALGKPTQTFLGRN